MVGDRDQTLHVLVDHQDRLAGRLQRGEASPDLLAHQRREPLGRLVEDEEVRIGHERPADGEHLLLAARELVAEVFHALRHPWTEPHPLAYLPPAVTPYTPAVCGRACLHLQERADALAAAPRRAFLTSGSAGSEPGAALAITRPAMSTEMRSASRNTASMSCYTSITVMRARMRLRSAIMFSDSSGPMPAIGSSRRPSRGGGGRARPTSMARGSPCARALATAR